MYIYDLPYDCLEFVVVVLIVFFFRSKAIVSEAKHIKTSNNSTQEFEHENENTYVEKQAERTKKTVSELCWRSVFAKFSLTPSSERGNYPTHDIKHTWL